MNYTHQQKQFQHPQTRLSQRLRSQMQELISSPSLKGILSFSAHNAPSEIQTTLLLPSSTLPSTDRKELKLRFRFDGGYPDEPPQLLLGCDLIPPQNECMNIINYDYWQTSLTMGEIIKYIVEQVVKNGLENVLNKIFNFNQKIQQTSRYNQTKNIINKQITTSFQPFVSPFSCFKPLSDSLPTVSPSLASNQSYTKAKKISLIKFQNQHQKLSQQKEESVKRKKDAKPMNKNANLPKFLIRIFIKYVERFKEEYFKKQYDKLQIECRKMRDWKRHDKKQHAFGLKHLKRFFQDEEEGYPSPDLNRKVIISIINQYILQEICQNSQIPESHRVGYLIACRVYSLRCRNSTLAGRIQSK